MGLGTVGEWVPEPLPPGALGAERPASPSPSPSPVAAAQRRPEPPPADVAAALTALLAAASAELRSPNAPLSAAQLLDRVRGLGRAVNVLQAELARTVAAAEDAEAAFADGLTHMAGWLRGHLNATPGESKAVLAAGRLQQRMPVLAAAAASGAVSPGQLVVVGRILTDRVWALGDAAGFDLAALDRVVTDTATGDQARSLPQVCQRIADQLDPDGLEPTDPTAGRSLRITRRADGSRGLRGDLDAIGGEKVEAALEAIAAAGRCEGDLRSRGQRAADALVQLADLHLAAGDLPVLRGTKPQVTALVQLGDLLDPMSVQAAATLGSGAVVSNLAARAAACDAVVNRVVLGPDGLPLDVGRTHRLVPAHVRRAAEVRDGGCVFAGCHNPTWMCDAHHVLHWIDGGATSLENTALLCERHHTQVHHGFTIRFDHDDGRWRTCRPDGSEILLGPLSAKWDHAPPPDGPLFVALPLGA